MKYRRMDNTDNADNGTGTELNMDEIAAALPKLVTSDNRTVGEPLNGCFIYPPSCPFMGYGLFPTEEDVDHAVKSSDNYKYYDELSCIYHMMVGHFLNHLKLFLCD